MSDKPEPVIALYDSTVPAETAARRLTEWMKTSSPARLEALAILAKADDGTVSMRKLGPRETLKGAAVGLLSGALTALTTDDLSVLQGLAAGAVGGGAVGALFRKKTHLSHEARSRIASRLSPGGAAVVAVVPPRHAATVTEKLVEYGGALDAAANRPAPANPASPSTAPPS